MKSEKELYDLLSKDVNKIQNMCRICLCDEMGDGFSLFVEQDEKPVDQLLPKMSLMEKLSTYGQVKIEMDDNLPKSVCKKCYCELNVAHLLRLCSQQSDLLLRKVLNHLIIKKENVSDDEPITDTKDKLDEYDLKRIKKESDDDELCQQFDDVDYEPVVVNKTQLSNDLYLKCNKTKEHETNESPKNKRNKFICQLCNKILSTKYIFNKHMKLIHGEENKTTWKEKEDWLVSGEGVDRRFHCPECDYKSRRRQGMQYHMTTHTGARPFECDQCSQTFTQHGRLYAHKKTHSDKMYYTCAECGKQFKHKDSFNKHKNVHNPEMNYVCKICNKALKTQKTLNEHINRHLQIKKFSCEFCGLAFVTRIDLIQHLRVHSQEKKFKCHLCSYCTYSKGSLDVHIKRHTGVRDFQCEFCNYTCFTRGTLKFHIRKHTKEQNYACPVCDMRFRQSTSVNTHMLKKHGEKFKWSSTVDRRLVK